MSIEAQDLCKAYAGSRALNGLSFAFDDSVKVLAFVGPSGGGKSTLLRLLGGLETADAGLLRVDGRQIPGDGDGRRLWRRGLGFLFQSYNLFPHLSAVENIVLPLVQAHAWTRERARQRAEEIMERFGLLDHLGKRPAQLSGGQQQRIALARAMAHHPALLILDEPTSALDPEMKAEVLDLLEELCHGGQRIVLSTHEMGFARRSADAVAFLAEGRIVESGAAELFFAEPQSPVARAFLGKVLKW